MKHGFVKVAAATPELRLADCDFNAKSVLEIILSAARQGVKLIALPELCICGCTCGDLFGQELLLDKAVRALNDVVIGTQKLDIVAVVGVPLRINGMLYNCAAVINRGKILGIVPQGYISGKDELSRGRYFTAACVENTDVDLPWGKIPFGTSLVFTCKELEELTLTIEVGESFCNKTSYANIVLSLYAASQMVGRQEYIRNLLIAQSGKNIAAYIRSDADTCESTTDLVFGGYNLIAENGVVLAESAPFSEDRLTVSEIDVKKIAHARRRNNPALPCSGNELKIEFSLDINETHLTRKISKNPFVPENLRLRNERCEEILDIQTAGLKRRWQHTHSKKVVLGISGGLDSALALLVAVRAADSIGTSRGDILAVTMPCFGTTARTKGNAEKLCELLGVELKHVDIKAAVNKHFEDIGMEPERRDAAYENSQARERTQVLMDIANMHGGFVLGTGDLSELALGWATYNGDHMSMYGVNGNIPKTLVRCLVRYEADRIGGEAKAILDDILDTPVSPELLPAEDGEIVQKTENLVGPYELHDFYLYHVLRWGCSPDKVYRLARYAFAGEYEDEILIKWIKNFYRRFFTQQFKRSCLPDGPKVGSVGLSPRGDWRMPSDAVSTMWVEESEAL